MSSRPQSRRRLRPRARRGNRPRHFGPSRPRGHRAAAEKVFHPESASRLLGNDLRV